MLRPRCCLLGAPKPDPETLSPVYLGVGTWGQQICVIQCLSIRKKVADNPSLLGWVLRVCSPDSVVGMAGCLSVSLTHSVSLLVSLFLFCLCITFTLRGRWEILGWVLKDAQESTGNGRRKNVPGREAGGSQAHSWWGRLSLRTLGSTEGGRQERKPMRTMF